MKNKSFTLIEILVVIIIIGILVSVVLFSTNDSTEKRKRLEVLTFSEGAKGKNLDSLISEWNFDEGDARDTWGNNNGTVTGATYVTKSENRCVYGGCYSFDGDDYIEILYSSNLNNPNSFTLSAWAKSSIPGSSYTDVGFILDIGEITTNGYGIFTESNKVGGYYNNKSLYSTNPLDTDWHNYVFAYNGTHFRFYRDGKIFANPDVVTVGTIYNYPLRIGAQSKSLARYFYGLIDDVRIYKFALSTSQIKQEYIAGLNSLLANNNISKEEYDQRLNSLSFK